MNRTILIGIDGAPYTMLDKFSRDGTMPNLSKLRNGGVFKQMMASMPDNSAVSWSSIMTGKNPGEHGIFGFTDMIPNTYTMKFPNFYNLNAPPFWHQNPEKKYVIINVPFTYPVKELNGSIVSGFVSPDLSRSAYPKEFLKFLKENEYEIDVDARKAYKSYDLFFQELFNVHEKRSNIFKKKFQEGGWDNFMVVFTGSDRLEHFMLHAYHDENHEYHSKFIDYFSQVDEEIGWIMDNADDDDNIIMMSDHGMVQIKTEVHLNTFLEKEGFLTLSEEKKNYNSITADSKAFVMEPGRVHINFEGKYPNGSIKPDDRKTLSNELMNAFNSLEYNGEKVLADIKTKDELYQGKKFDEAPDLILIPNDGYSLRGTIGNEQIYGSDSILTGMHKGSDAFLLVKGNNAKQIVNEQPHVEDIVNIMNKLEE